MKRPLPALAVLLLAATIAFSLPSGQAIPKKAPKRAVRASKAKRPPVVRPAVGRTAKLMSAPTGPPVGTMCTQNELGQVNCGCGEVCHCTSECPCYPLHLPGLTTGSSAGTNSGGTTAGTNAGTSSGGTNAGDTSAGGTNAGDTSAGGTNAGTNSGGTNSGETSAGGTNGGETNAGGTNAGSSAGTNAGTTGGFPILPPIIDPGSTGGGTGTSGGTPGGGSPDPDLDPDLYCIAGYIGPWSVYWYKSSLKGGVKLSGTNAKIKPKLRIVWEGGTWADNSMPCVWIGDITIRFNAKETVTIPVNKWINRPEGTPARQAFDCEGGTLVFATTHFADGPISSQVRVDVGIPNVLSFPWWWFQFDGPMHFEPVAYNRGLTLSTDLVSRPDGTSHIYDPRPQGDGPYGDPSDSGYSRVPPTSWRIAAIAKRAFAALHHSMVNPNDRLTKASVLNGLKTATTFFSMTHGSAGSFATYAGPDTFGLTDSVWFVGSEDRPNDVATAVARSTEVPGLNLVIMHACETVPDMYGSDVGTITNAYRGFFGPTITPNIAYADFGLTVYSTLKDYYSGSDRCLDQHADHVYLKLWQGYTIQEALNDANQEFPALSIVGDELKHQLMVYSGDPYARLIGVYTGAATPGYNPLSALPSPPSAWYKVLNP